ncbi:hypothetical protein VT98_14671 [Candidatus Electrothrix communis]|uniref:Uncharacterized protein n=1 Tax=Candidatus Electrothrix communis TaxID=1859133 RepID=A0A444IQA8_9BACT|nr:hypothetical protein [Desulfobulbus sp. US5]RWX43030.1 hypothetical protein VT98_14671 [Candidatus Electrothrix communis]
MIAIEGLFNQNSSYHLDFFQALITLYYLNKYPPKGSAKYVGADLRVYPTKRANTEVRPTATLHKHPEEENRYELVH